MSTADPGRGAHPGRAIHPVRAGRGVALPAVVGSGGVAVAAAVAALGGIGGADAVRLVAGSAVAAVLAGTAGWSVLRGLSRRSIGAQTTVIALVPVVAVALGATWAARGDMFITTHDVWVLGVVLAAAGAAGAAAAAMLDRRVSTASRSVGELIRTMGEDGPAAPSRPGAMGRAPGELSALADELARTSHRLSEARSQAEALERSRRELVAWVSHDLRTPLSGIRAMVEALEDGVVTDAATVQRYHATISREVDRLAGLVDSLFELSRIHAGALALGFEPVPLGELLDDALAATAAAAAAKHVDVRLLVPDPGPLVDLSTPEMIRVIRNLMDNAIRHTPPHGSIIVSAALDGPDVAEVRVQDACGGIPERDLALVFDPAFHGDAARTPTDGGGGFGLAVARGLVDAHGGAIAVRNSPPGCCFTVRLPIRAGT